MVCLLGLCPSLSLALPFPCNQEQLRYRIQASVSMLSLLELILRLLCCFFKVSLLQVKLRGPGSAQSFPRGYHDLTGLLYPQ